MKDAVKKITNQFYGFLTDLGRLASRVNPLRILSGYEVPYKILKETVEKETQTYHQDEYETKKLATWTFKGKKYVSLK
ncbi:hypothetical protein CEXT_33211 [Caerostris extrusa]|uniref:Uncharacterized protein n=1 Tax=Caerostris extrusa TaxID=172846 RepID=A0AAV4XCL2_CAEEX|nr:hypothetical protein CEXT_33211 [Caerostris extrusa]